MNDVLGLLALFVLVLLNGFFVAAEFSLVSVRRTRIDQLAEQGHVTAKITQKALKNLDLYIAATQLGITMASLGIGFIAEPAIEHLLHPVFAAQNLSDTQSKAVSFGIAFAFSTVLHIVFGELAPKTWALQRSEQVALLVTRPIMLFTGAFRIFIVGLNMLGNGVVRMFGLKAVAGHHLAYSEEEIRMIVGASNQEGVLEDSEKELVYNVFDLADTTVREVMTPRIDMIMIQGQATLKDLMALNAEHNYSRLPVYQTDSDHIIGVVHVSDILGYLEHLNHTTVSEIMRPVFFVPEAMKIRDLLTKFKEKKAHMSIVVDEFGGTAGLVTLEDALEEIVGEIYDETDEDEEQDIQVISENVFLMNASLVVYEVENYLGTNLEDGEAEYDTLSGFMMSHLGDIPTVGQALDYAGWRFTVTQADERRVYWLRVEKLALMSEQIAEQGSST